MRSSSSVRLVLTSTVAVALVGAAVVLPDFSFSRTESVRSLYQATSEQSIALALADDGHNHRHDDPTTKNTITRAGLEPGTEDPTTAVQARRNTNYVASQRKLPDPKLKRVDLQPARRKVPQNRYAVAGGCYSVAGTPVWFQPTDLGVNLLYSKQRTFLTGGKGTANWAAQPSTAGEWVTRTVGKKFTFQLGDGSWLTKAGPGFATGSTPTKFKLRRTKGCAAYPEAQVNVTGNPHAGITDFQEVRGYVDPHVHGMAFEFLGGNIHCGKPWDKYGAPYALQDCKDHKLTDGKGALLESVLSGKMSHDPAGWPKLTDWPAPESLTHEGTYYKWLERSWRGGQRVFVNLLVENGKLCQIYPSKRNSCDDMDSARLQAQRMRQMERYIDAQYGGPGKGWYRIVTDPFQARKVINQGKLAVIMGIEVSIPFGCTMKLDIPQCNKASITRQLNELHKIGVRQWELVNKFDNALAGVAGDEGAVGPLVNVANFLETGSFWAMKHCEPSDGESADKTQLAFPDIAGSQQDALFGAVADIAFGLKLPIALPIYGRPMHCNRRGLTDLGEYVLELLRDKHSLIDPDHMSVKARQSTLDLMDEWKYSGVVSSHSWSTPDAYPRIYKLGGFIAPMAGDSTGFVQKWKRHLGWADKRYYFGFGYGADINGLAQQGMPRGADAKNKVTYPIRGLNGVKINKQRSGERVYDVNVDGVAHYGLYPDWIQDLVNLGGGQAIQKDLGRGAEAYLQTWERAYGLRADSCRNANLRKSVAKVGKLVKRGMTTRKVMKKVGQPYQRLGNAYVLCAWHGGKSVKMKVTFTNKGKVSAVRRA
ncbi:hypothetical protein [Nocardioides daejeonensis]|uniref:hypothetical protein n=1 Tax=Nocardioides daejeonensis TaxID=1046556 RepID=UPI0013A54C3F|nr:hypothetical protein [Nocardioides daejeonensis]